MGQQNLVQALKAQAALQELALGPFPTVNEETVFFM
jgi:hypothetical protein